MKHIKLYDVIFPIWILLFFPPVILLSLAGDFVIDSIVLTACFFAFKLSSIGKDLKSFYRKSIMKVWLLGFLSDIIGAAFLLAIVYFDKYIPDKLMSAICYDPFSSIIAVIIIIFAMLVSSLFIFIFNYFLIFKNQFAEKALRIKLSLTIAIATIPWTFLLPTKWFFY